MLNALRQLPTKDLVNVGSAALRMARLCEATGQDELALCHSATLVLCEWALFERAEMVDLDSVGSGIGPTADGTVNALSLPWRWDGGRGAESRFVARLR
jgi:hypothetical protein